MLAIDTGFMTGLLQQLVRINSINPALAADGPGEAEIADHTANVLTSLGLEVFLHEPSPGRVSVVGRLRGAATGPSLMLNAHYDTVGVADMAEPFSGALREGRVFGRGAYDMKGSLAACITAIKALQDEGVRLAGDLLVAAVADEEHGSIGTADLVGRYPVDGAIVTEPSSLNLTIAHKGFTWIELETQGRAAHGSRPELGIDANVRMGRVLVALEALDRQLQQRPHHSLLGPASLHAALLRGGTGLSTYAASATLQVERRTLPGETEEQVLAELREITHRLAAEDPSFHADLRPLLTRAPFETHRDAPIVQAVASAATTVLQRPPRYQGDTPWMDAALLAAAGTDTVVIGPHGEGAHAAVEWVDLHSVEQLARILALTAMEYCGTQG